MDNLENIIPLDFALDYTFQFSDGNVILITQGVGFQVYAGVLIQHSPVLRDKILAQGPAPEAGAFMIRSVLIDDPPHAFRHVLVWMFAGAEEHRNKGRRDNRWKIEELYYCMVLGVKYQIAALINECAKYLQTYFPSTLQGWFDTPHQGPYVPEQIAYHHVLTLVALARYTGQLFLLPTLYIASTGVPAAQLLEGVTLPDGVRVTLSDEDINGILQARMLLPNMKVYVGQQVYALPVPDGCRTLGSGACRTALQRLMWRLLEVVDEPWPVRADPFRKWATEADDDDDDGSRLCTKCTEMLILRGWDIMQAIWYQLPCRLGIVVPEWPGSMCLRHCLNLSVECDCT
ncbi:hypothetical protein C8Q79DRAFT_993410 [Trametes meyenii]|nr:hypothetical protein C8Q79DRAFT_993410 [Trametes meyenii]